jgi:hypothetical protein
MNVIMKVMFWHSTFCTHFHHIVLHKHTLFFMKVKIINDIGRCNYFFFCKPQSSITLGDTILSLFCKFHNLSLTTGGAIPSLHYKPYFYVQENDNNIFLRMHFSIDHILFMCSYCID